MSRFLEAHIASLAIGSAVALGIYVFYGPSGGRQKRGELRGLVNSGNHCFVNAVVQALAACPCLQGWLEETCSKRDARTVRGSLLELLRQLNNLSSASSSSSSLSPALLLAALRAHGWRINTEEQDAHEMLHVVMTTIEEELEFRKADAKPSHASLLDISNIGLEDDDDDSDDLEGASPAGGPFTPGRFTRGVSLPPTPAAETPPRNPWDSGRAVSVSRDTSPSGKRRFTRRRSNSGVICKLGSELPSNVVSSFTKPKCQTPFTGLITCKVTPASPSPTPGPVSYSSFNNITLSLPSSSLGAVSLDTLLQMFVSQERVEGGTLKQNTFGKLPECLCFHVQRTGFGGGQPYKRHDYVEFPVLLNMDRYTHTSQLVKARAVSSLGGGSAPSSLTSLQGQQQYQLRAVVVHMGGIHSGHYVTYRRGPLGSKSGNRWFHTSDSTAKQVPFSEVSRAPAYMLFYERESQGLEI